MSNITYYTPGPSQLYPGMDTFFQNALKEDVGSISHRSASYKKIHQAADEALREIFGLSADHHILFTSSATEIWERLIVNCVKESSYHFVNGSFSTKFLNYANKAGKNTFDEVAKDGNGFYVSKSEVPSEVEMICVTHNETSTGVSTPEEEIHKLKNKYPEKLMAVDGVSSLPHPNLDFQLVDSAFLSVQKCFGLPAGLGVWIINDACVAKANELKSKNKIMAPHHQIPELVNKAKNFQTPATPNVLGIYLLKCVAEKMVEKGIDTIRKETTQKAKMIHEVIKDSKFLSHFVENPDFRSETVIVAKTKVPSDELNKQLALQEMQVGSGYGDYKKEHIRIANFPAISIEQAEKLANELKAQENIIA